MRQIADGIFAARDTNSRGVEAVVRPLEEALEQAQLVEDFHGRRVNRVAAEIAEEIGVLLEHPYGAAGPCKEQSGHHRGRPAANDDEVRKLCC